MCMHNINVEAIISEPFGASFSQLYSELCEQIIANKVILQLQLATQLVVVIVGFYLATQLCSQLVVMLLYEATSFIHFRSKKYLSTSHISLLASLNKTNHVYSQLASTYFMYSLYGGQLCINFFVQLLSLSHYCKLHFFTSVDV